MKMTNSQFEAGRIENYKRDYHKNRYNWAGLNNSNWSPRSTNFEYTNSTETTENSLGFEFKVPLSEISLENLKIIPAKNYLIVQSNKKTIFISLDKEINLDTFSNTINGDMLIIDVKKLKKLM